MRINESRNPTEATKIIQEGNVNEEMYNQQLQQEIF